MVYTHTETCYRCRKSFVNDELIEMGYAEMETFDYCLSCMEELTAQLREKVRAREAIPAMVEGVSP